MMAACYLADPLGSRPLSLKFLVLEAAELSAQQGRGGQGLRFPTSPRSLNQRLQRRRRCRGRGLGRANKVARQTLPPKQHLPSYAALLGGSGAVGGRPAGAWLRVGGRVSGPLPQGKPGWGPLSRGPWGAGAPGPRRGRAPRAAPSPPPPRLLCVAVKRLSIKPVWTVEREHKGCLLSG